MSAHRLRALALGHNWVQRLMVCTGGAEVGSSNGFALHFKGMDVAMAALIRNKSSWLLVIVCERGAGTARMSVDMYVIWRFVHGTSGRT